MDIFANDTDETVIVIFETSLDYVCEIIVPLDTISLCSEIIFDRIYHDENNLSDASIIFRPSWHDLSSSGCDRYCREFTLRVLIRISDEDFSYL